MHSARLLVVEDNPDLAENLVEILMAARYDARSASTCAGALEVAAEGLDLALVDLRLPDGDGTALAARLKEVQPDCEVILLTGFASVESAAAAVRAGAYAYLIKPCATPEILLSVEQALRQVRLHQEKRELTRRTQVAEKLAAVGTLTAGLSHEIRNPLNAAGLQLSVLERRVRRLDTAQQPDLLEPLLLVKDEIRRLDQVLEDFLQFARPVQFTPRPVSIPEVLAKVKSLFQTVADQRGVRLEQRCAEDLPAVAGDEGRLRQLLVNLTLNALDATPKGGVVSILCDREDREAVLKVEDDGPGIPADLLGRIFEPFFTTKPHGSGLGLPIVHAVVTQHGGTLTAENRAEGGARFTARLPLVR
jgi:two-component system sensor histidine kinase HydH